MTLPAVTCEWSSRTLCRPIARDTWTPLGLSSSSPPRGHPKGILDLASIANRGESAHVVPSCYGYSTVDLRTNAKNDSCSSYDTSVGTDRYRQTKCTAAGSGSALRDSNGWFPPVARHGRLQRLQRLHHRYQKKQDPTRLKCKLTVKFIARHVSSHRVSGKHDCPANRNSHTEISRNRAETKGGEKEEEEEEEEEEAVPLRSLSRKLAKEDGESFHLRAAQQDAEEETAMNFALPEDGAKESHSCDTSRNNHRRGTMFILRILVEARSIKRPSCR
ncbi:hypothetical protein ALC56_03345 [Trachymyrmex septentrionalis]|uniref:Uncharacterized protein n=1 Tax=Trachymyrmex septentrionalis TaxID=34720 RepID=A0A195FPH4_9HYME|nr:hypothetical protein ALC56_03345 [Trachymyrmex septentrionalis]